MRYRSEFDPYGQLLMEWSDVSPNLNNRKFAGYERDPATGLDYANARMYTGIRGRFMQPDPKGLIREKMSLPQSLNRYSFVANDPINHTDPSGEDWSIILRFFAESECNARGGGFYGFYINEFGQVFIECDSRSRPIIQLTKQLLEELGEWQPRRRGVRVPLQGTKLANFNSEVGRLVFLLQLPASDCSRFLTLHLGNDARGSFLLDAVLSQRAFDGELSTISLKDAGISPLEPTIQVNEFLGLTQADAIRTDSYRQGFFATEKDVYYSSSGIKAPVILHETLHYYLGLGDMELADKFGLTAEWNRTKDSRIISNALADGGCK